MLKPVSFASTIWPSIVRMKRLPSRTRASSATLAVQQVEDAFAHAANPACATSTTVTTARSTSVFLRRQLSEHPAREDLLERAVHHPRREPRVAVGTHLPALLRRFDHPLQRMEHAAHLVDLISRRRGCARPRGRAPRSHRASSTTSRDRCARTGAAARATARLPARCDRCPPREAPRPRGRSSPALPPSSGSSGRAVRARRPPPRRCRRPATRGIPCARRPAPRRPRDPSVCRSSAQPTPAQHNRRGCNHSQA